MIVIELFFCFLITLVGHYKVIFQQNPEPVKYVPNVSLYDAIVTLVKDNLSIMLHDIHNFEDQR